MPSINFGSPTVSGEVSVTTNTSLPQVGSTQTIRFDTRSGTSGVGTLGAVPTGKIWYIVGFTVYTSGASIVLIRVDTGAGTIKQALGCSAADAEAHSYGGGFPMCSFTAGQQIYYACGANTVFATIIEVDA